MLSIWVFGFLIIECYFLILKNICEILNTKNIRIIYINKIAKVWAIQQARWIVNVNH